MAISYPRDLPAGDWFASATFALSEGVAFNQLEGGALQIAEMSDPLWTLKASTYALFDKERRAVWQAWLASLRGGKRFRCYHLDRPWPLAYGAGAAGLSWSVGAGLATLSAYSATTLTLSDLPAGYKVTAGDMMSFEWHGTLALHMALEDVTAAATSLKVTVDPPVRSKPAPSMGIPISLIKAPCVMVVKPGTASSPASAEGEAASFEAVQVVV